MRKSDEDCVCMEYRVEGRRPVGQPRTWLESVEANMAELEIDREDVHDSHCCCQPTQEFAETPPSRETSRGPVCCLRYISECS